MLITTSNDITTLLADVIFDLSQVPAVVKVHNRCVGAHLNLVKLAFELYDINNKPLHVGNFTTPDALANFSSDYSFTEPLTEFDNSILWSGAPYRFVLRAKDNAGNEFVYVPEQRAVICTPSGNANVGKNFGEAKLDVSVDCAFAEAKIIDTTNYSYKGITGALVSKKITILSPADDTGAFPAAVEYNDLSAILHPLAFSGIGFQAVISTVMKYDMQNGDGTGNTFVIIKYIKNQPFDVTCNYDICPLLCRYGEFLDEVELACDPAKSALAQKVTEKIVKLILAKEQPTCGFNIGKLIDDVKKLAGWHDCNCECNRSIGLNGTGITTGGLNFQFTVDGDITASAVVTGNNINLFVKDYSYVFKMADTPGSAAFTIGSKTVGRLKTFELTVNVNTLADEILTEIAGDSVLKAKFIAIYGDIFKLNVDPECILPAGGGKLCNYVISADGIPTTVKFGNVIFGSITIDGQDYPINLAMAGSTTALIQQALNSLNKFTCVCTYDGGTGIFTITINGATVDITKAIVVTSAVDRYMIIKKDCSGTVKFDPSTLIQAMIKYICRLTAKQVKLGGTLNVCHPTVDKFGNIIFTTFQEKNSMFEIIEDLTKSQCEVIAKLLNITGPVDCDKLKNIFKANLKKVDNATVLYGLKENECSSISLEEISGKIWEYIIGRPDFCTAIQTCIGGGGICGPVVNFIVDKVPSGTSGCTTCTDLTSLLS